MSEPPESPFRSAAIASQRESETSGSPVDTPVRRRGAATVRLIARMVADVFAAAWARLRPGARPLAFVPQVEAADCGAACLVTVLGYHGIPVSLVELRRRLDAGRNGASALSLLRVARSYGLVARGVRAEMESLDLLPTGTILHWNLNHFVVLERSLGPRRGIRVMDPAYGYRDVPMRLVDRSFSGVALVFEGPRAPDAVRPSEPARHPWARVLPLLREPRLLGAIALAGITSQALILAYPYLLRYLLDNVVPNAEFASARTLVWLVLPLMLTQFFVLGIRAVNLSWLRARVDYRLSVTILNKMLSLPYSSLLRRSTGDLLMRVRSTAALRQVFTTVVLSGIIDGLTALSLFVVVAFLDLRLGLVALGVVVLQVTVLAAAWRSQWQLTVAGLEAQAASQGRLVEMLTGVETIKIAGVENDTADVWAQLLADETNWEVQRSISGGVTDGLLRALQIASPVLLIVVGAMQVLNARSGVGEMVAAVSLSVAALTPITAMLGSLFQLAMARAHLDRINDVFDEESEPEGTYAPDTAEGSLRAEAVSFSYPGTAAPVLRDLDLSVEPGECVVVLGPSGSGKSTLATVLSGLNRPSAGHVLLDGVDIAEYTASSRRSLCGFVPQDPHFFGSSIRDNITLFREFPDDVIRGALEAAFLADDVARLPAGLDTILVEGGKSLSGGQLQRLGLARALVAAPRVLILDEATSALDPVAERAVLDRVLDLGITTVLITHRESVAARADRVLTMAGGRLVPAAAE